MGRHKRKKGQCYKGGPGRDCTHDNVDINEYYKRVHGAAREDPISYDTTLAKRALAVIGGVVLAVLFWLESKGY